MRPDLFAGPVQRDDSHRILARLANGGVAPSAARQWVRWDTLQRARVAAIIALLAAIAAAWVWLQEVGAPAQPRQGTPLRTVAQVPTERPAQPPRAAYPSTQAATIVNEPAHPPPAMAQASAVAAARPEPRLVRPHPVKPAAPIRAQRNEAPPDGDEDVTLLAAMLKHANGQKPAPTPPKN